MELIGRDQELTELVARLGQRRLVTVTGPGGIGKTRLAQAAASAVAANFEYGAITVDLTRVDHPDGVFEAIAGQLGYADFESLMNSPGDQPALIVFDNCEHVLDAAADATARVLAACTMPTVLATSRSPLDLPEEAVVMIGPLATPRQREADPSSASMVLLLARVIDNGIDVSDADLDEVAEICRRLDGVPLALEIAAARLRTMTTGELLAELELRPHALARRSFRGKPSHRSVADVVGWSCDLLGVPQRRLFSRLGVFAGPFTAAMASAVVDPDGGPPSPLRDRLHDLVEASLVVADTTSDVTWFRLLHPVRAVAVDQLRTSGLHDEVHSRLIDHIVELAVGVIAETTQRWDAPVLSELLVLYDNIAAALRWTVDHDPDASRALVLLAVLWGVVHQSHTAEVAGLGEAVLARWPDRETAGWADAAATVATCRCLLGDPEQAIALAEHALGHIGASAYAPSTLRRVMAQAHRALGSFALAEKEFRAAADVAARNGVHALAMEQRADQALVLAELGDPVAALAMIDDVLIEAQERGATVNAAWARCVRGAVLVGCDDRRAVEVLERALDESRSIGYPAGTSFALRQLAIAHVAAGHTAAACRTLLSLIDALLQTGGLNDMRMVLDPAAVLLEQHDAASWADLAVTAAALPVTSVGTSVELEVSRRAEATGSVLTVRDAYVTCRRELRALLQRASAADEATSSGSTELGDDRRAGLGIELPLEVGASLIRSGDVWTMTFAGADATIRTSKGVEDLARLLAEPDREISCLDLTGASVVSADTGEVLDATARRRYEQRVRDLREDIDEAEANNDIAMVDKLTTELDVLVDELTAALGIGGRRRRTGGDAERARSAVTQRVRASIRRISELHPVLGDHLDVSIITGSFCCYRPRPTTTWSVRF